MLVLPRAGWSGADVTCGSGCLRGSLTSTAVWIEGEERGMMGR